MRQTVAVSPTSRAPWIQRVGASTAGTWLAALLFIALPFIAANIGTKLFMPDAGLREWRNLIKALVLIAGYWAYVRFWERRPARELSVSGAGAELLAGLLLGGLLFSGVVAILTLLGAYSLNSVGTLGDLGAVLASMAPRIAAGALIEELIFRLVLLRLLERSFGTAWALAISSLLFGLAHLGNAGATPLIGVLLGLELGLLFGAAYLLTRRIWLCAALHFAWNFVQGAVFSIAVSGQSGESWLHGTLTGPAWLSGGAFGAEGSLVSVVLCLAAAGVLLRLASRRGRYMARSGTLEA
ncbi:type II CAAX prenyl endopeptidase Rce1 family protein [Roseateles sp. So40a]|uniref:CPBP family glutamic-type intramembrane protease n=1 Tax=Roseateles sp. So40a TaxID=3400226 RepID=UPI003A8B2A83